MNPRDLTKITTTPDYASWNSLRQSEDSRYIGLAMPRVLSRLPYGAKTKPVEGFAFEESTDGSDHHKYSWMNAAWAMAANINRSFKLYGWCSRIRGVESGGAVTNLPVHTFPTDDGGVAMKCPTEIAIDDRREAELAKLGLMPILHRKNTDVAAFIGAQSLQKPQEYVDPDATANANLSARLPYLYDLGIRAVIGVEGGEAVCRRVDPRVILAARARRDSERSPVRIAVFVIEQNIPEELEWDEHDVTSVHVLAEDAAGTPVGCGRLLPDGHIGRMAVLPGWRGHGVGAALLQSLEAECDR